MSHKRDYIPQGDADYDRFFKNLVQYVAQKCAGSPPAWTHIPKAAQDALADAYSAWYTAYAITLKPHTPQDTKEKNRVKESGKKLTLRPFIKAYIRYHPAVTNADRDAVGVPNDDTVRTPIGVPKTHPLFDIQVKDIRALNLLFHDEGTESRAIPYGFDGAVIYWLVADAPITLTKALTNSELATRSPHTLIFGDEDRGKTVSFAMRWQNETGKKGPWSEIQSTIVP
jgi:hypothetical protein